ncbi:MAG: bifunctional folylpolyglutamate synthase/dihydrofolate synthase [Ruminococcaceae bacterium]|nr:bifunctional folylpolyglutamate synthase/dihydrofolate synthase [Oscillospiraceae bacterium]
MKHSNKSFTYEDALDFIHGALKLGSKLGLSNIRELLQRLDRPQDKVQCIHIAGTNGKGTVTTSLAAVLSAAGYRVGAYTSPYVFRFNERIQIDGEEIADDSLTRNTLRVKETCAAMVAEGLPHPTEFEIVTAVGFLCFAEEKCDYVVLEVGLGGRLDATNVIENPLCTAITSIGFDHMQYLGNSLSEIAAEKCGILKEGVPAVVYGQQPEEALAVIRAACAEKKATMRMADVPKIREAGYRGSIFSAGGYHDLFLPLAGEHMAKNACVTLEIIRVLREKGISVPDEAIYEGFRSVRHRGRLETVAEDPLFILDGAHNLDGIDALCRAVDGMFGGKKIVLIAGMLADKEYGKAMEKTGGLSEKLITVTVPSPRALSAEKLAETAMPYHQNVTAAPSIPAAVAAAYAEKPDVILAFGSLYMLGEVYEAVQAFQKDKKR